MSTSEKQTQGIVSWLLRSQQLVLKNQQCIFSSFLTFLSVKILAFLQDRLSEVDKYLSIAISLGNNHHTFEKLLCKVLAILGVVKKSIGLNSTPGILKMPKGEREAKGRKENKPIEGFKSIRCKRKSNGDD